MSLAETKISLFPDKNFILSPFSFLNESLYSKVWASRINVLPSEFPNNIICLSEEHATVKISPNFSAGLTSS